MKKPLKDMARAHGNPEVEKIDRKSLTELEKRIQEIYPVLIEQLKAKPLDRQGALTAFVEHPDFPVIYNSAVMIDSEKNRWAYVLRKAHEIGDKVGLEIYSVAQMEHIWFKQKLEGYGIDILCPYFCWHGQQGIADTCSVSGAPEPTICTGDGEGCKVMAEAGKTPPKPRAVVRKIPYMKVEPVDLQDLDDWWKGEGKYR
jgi:hypothetical protein